MKSCKIPAYYEETQRNLQPFLKILHSKAVMEKYSELL